MAELISLIVLFIALSGLLALVDAAVMSISRAEIEEMILQKRWGATALQLLHRRLTRAVVVVVIFTNTVNILGPILVGQRAIALFGSDIIGVITGVLTFATIIFSEIIPKSLGAHYAPFISRIAAPLIVLCVWALFPLVWLLERIAGFFKTGRRKIGTEAQIRSLVTIGRRAGHIEGAEDQLIHRAFILNDKTAADIMTPLKKVVAVRRDATVREAAEVVLHHVHSRYPVFGKSADVVCGLVISHDILEAISIGKDHEPVETIMRPVLLVAALQRCDHLLALFRDRHLHLAIVQEKGKTIGLVTLEDVLEELVGEIEDEKNQIDVL